MGEEVIRKTQFEGLNGSVLKYIAIITMLIDHIGAILVAPMVYQPGRMSMCNPEHIWTFYEVLRSIGRIAFPIFCFFLVEGFFYTRNVKKYAFRLFLFAIISEIPFNLGFYGKMFYLGGQNVYFTLLIGLGVMIGLKYVDSKEIQSEGKLVAARIAVTAAGCLLAVILETDYHMYGILSIVVLYMYRLEGNKLKQLIMGAITFLWEPWALLAFPLLYLYNGKRGKQPKYLFYAFYPIHILVLYGISIMI